MAWMKNIAVALTATLLTTSCSMYRLEELRNTTPQGTPFQNALSRLYMDFATQEEKEYDWFNSWHFADKGLMLAYGKDMGPEDLDDWKIPAEAQHDLENARARLMAVLQSDRVQVSPSRTAEAQFYFDCWVRYQEANWQEDKIAYCRDNLAKALDEVGVPSVTPLSTTTQHVKKSVRSAVKTVKKVKKSTHSVTSTKEPAQESFSYAVFFEPEKAEISEQGRNVIDEVIKSVKNVSDYEIVLHSSVGPAGKTSSDLTNERVQVVKKALTTGGVSSSAIMNSDDPAAAPSSKAGSRRIELFLNE